MRKFLGTVFIVLIVMSFASCVLVISSFKDGLPIKDLPLKKPSILSLKLDGIIIDGKEFLDNLEKYAKETQIKGVLIQVNSPGGVVGPSQEIFAEIRRVRDELKKPVVVSVLGLGASGAYYAALGANKIFVNPGSLVGSIGVIMEFANLEKLYEWAKIQRYVIKTGNYKDSGAEYRPMRDDERQLFQSMANEVLAQFKKDIADNRKLDPQLVDQYSDGRIFTGQTAVRLGLADEVGTLRSAIKTVGQLAGLGETPNLYVPPPPRGEFLKELMGEARANLSLDVSIRDLVRAELWGQPLFIMPSAVASH